MSKRSNKRSQAPKPATRGFWQWLLGDSLGEG
jgi:hypothetical protein